MSEGGFFEPRRISPTGVTIVVLVHAAAIGALAMSKMDVEVMKVFTPLQIRNVPLPPEPDPVPPPPKPEPQPAPRSEVTYVPPIVPAPPTNHVELPAILSLGIPAFDPGPVGEADPRPVPRADPPPQPVRVDARMRSGDPQPPYPASEQRAGNEGSVRVRVAIGADGRVKSVEKISATSDAFFRATERHALRAWRFAPATVDGKAVESVKTLTVQFRLDG